MSKDGLEDLGDNSAKQLAGFIERIEQLEAEKAQVSDRIKAEKAEAKATGFDVKAINQLLKDRKGDMDATTENRAIVATYRRALKEHAGGELAEWAEDFEAAQNAASGAMPEPSNVVAMTRKEPLN